MVYSLLTYRRDGMRYADSQKSGAVAKNDYRVGAGDVACAI
jgi:hypothetical protein